MMVVCRWPEIDTGKESDHRCLNGREGGRCVCVAARVWAPLVLTDLVVSKDAQTVPMVYN
ncbi:hypothetical protein HanIR_Chr17g0845811 [Helianthus annuus]|nr:hypothetical protein HanIR_Chr17g0845811 [Helianthus annuus]